MRVPQVSKDDLKKLFVHGIPPSAQPADLLQLFEACTCACPTVEGDTRDRRGIPCNLSLSCRCSCVLSYHFAFPKAASSEPGLSCFNSLYLLPAMLVFQLMKTAGLILYLQIRLMLELPALQDT